MPTDLSQFTSATPLAILAVALLISLLKPYAEASFLPAAAPLHDTTHRVGAVVAGALLVVLATLVSGHAATGPVLFAAVIEDAKAGLLAIASYHLLTGNLFSDSGTPLLPARGGPPAAAVPVGAAEPTKPPSAAPAPQIVLPSAAPAPAPTPVAPPQAAPPIPDAVHG
jgi:hypothetical protein